jgi:methyl-accepting chemotaxis protein
MASTTEELTGQSEQLVSALAFFRTGEDQAFSGRGKPPARAGAAPNGRVSQPAVAGRTAARGGVNIRLADKQDNLDGEFERY